MLQHEPPVTEQTPSPAERRVTPEELAKALAAVEARKEQSSRETEGTIPIGEAVQQLGFDASPEEIWAEVQAQRQNQEQVMTRLPKKTRRRLWIGACVGLLGLIGMSFAIDASQNSNPNDTTSATISAPLQVITPSTPQTVIKTLAEIPNNGTFFCDEDTSRKLLQHPAEADHVLVTVGQPATGQQNDASWTFTKHGGKIYVHGYTAPRSAAAMRLGHVPIQNEPLDDTNTAGGLNYDQPITLAVGAFRLDSFDADDYGNRRMSVSAIHPDGHFGDNWKIAKHDG